MKSLPQHHLLSLPLLLSNSLFPDLKPPPPRPLPPPRSLNGRGPLPLAGLSSPPNSFSFRRKRGECYQSTIKQTVIISTLQFHPDMCNWDKAKLYTVKGVPKLDRLPCHLKKVHCCNPLTRSFSLDDSLGRPPPPPREALGGLSSFCLLLSSFSPCLSLRSRSLERPLCFCRPVELGLS